MTPKSLLSLSLPLTVALVLAAAPLHAQVIDPLWVKAVARVESTKGLVASEIQAQMEVSDSDGKVKDRVDTKSKLTGWKDGEPVRVQTSSEESKKSDAKDAKVDIGLANRPEEVLNGISIAQRQGESTVDSRVSVVFQVVGEAIKKDKKVPFTGKVWVDKDTGSVMKIDYVFDPKDVPKTKKLSQSIVFGPDKDGTWLPKNSVIDATMSVVFLQFNVAMRLGFESWVKRP
jgi:hypothetical protein